MSRVPVVRVMAAEGEAKKKAPKKRTDPAVKRAMLAVERRLYNKARKSACATRIKKVGSHGPGAAWGTDCGYTLD